ncbi:sulfate permease [Xylariaceae sp. FL1651]|nr:sulfate permease [Xylariaceae sp. FL1651]
MSSDKVGRGLAKAVGIDVDKRSKTEPTTLLQSAAANLESRSIDPYYEKEPSVKEFLLEHRPTLAGVSRYFYSLFPFLGWIFHYNLTWLMGDLIAGITVGFVVVPQGMAYALLAGLKPEYGLYTSFVGFILYFLFATSKDITIGTVAVMSTLVGRIVVRVMETHPEFTPEEIARGLSVIAGAILLLVGLLRLGWLVEFIPLVGICSFMTGAALNIGAGQVPKLLGISSVNTRDATYLVIINTLRGLPSAKLDAALGLTALFLLYAIREFCKYMAKRQPARQKIWFFIGTLRLAFVILLYTLISWLANRGITDSKKAKFSILGTVPSGFRVHGAPKISTDLISALAPDLPATIFVLIIEHIAISKSFGRINNYVINPSQELVAIGFTNVFGPFLGAYPATGSFSRTAIKAKAGVRTPLAGLWTALLVVLALYALTTVFFYIPMASLSGLIIHAVGDLLTPPATVYQFWQVSPIEVVLFFAGVLIMVFTDIETGVYFTVAASGALLLLRIAKAHGSFLGKVDVYRVSSEASDKDSTSEQGTVVMTKREAFLPLSRKDGSNANINIQNPYPGVFVYRFSEGLNYTNTARYMDELVAYIQKHTRPTTLDRYEKVGDRPWNNPGPRRGQVTNAADGRPVLRAVVLDFASVNNVDVTSIQGLIDTRTQLDYHTYPERAEWHVADVSNRWTRRALAASGFGFPRTSADTSEDGAYWKPIFSVAAAEGQIGPVKEITKVTAKDIETGLESVDRISSSSVKGDVMRANGTSEKLAVLQGVNRPYFHIDVAAAVENAIANIDGSIAHRKIA